MASGVRSTANRRIGGKAGSTLLISAPVSRRLPEAERRALVVDAAAISPCELALGAGREAAASGLVDRGREVIDAVGQLHLGLGAVGRQDAQRRRGLVGAPRAG